MDPATRCVRSEDRLHCLRCPGKKACTGSSAVHPAAQNLKSLSATTTRRLHRHMEASAASSLPGTDSSLMQSLSWGVPGWPPCVLAALPCWARIYPCRRAHHGLPIGGHAAIQHEPVSSLWTAHALKKAGSSSLDASAEACP